jgi:hypothetical protein
MQIKDMPAEKSQSEASSEENLKKMTVVEKLRQWYNHEIYNQFTLIFKDPNLCLKFRKAKYESIL